MSIAPMRTVSDPAPATASGPLSAPLVAGVDLLSGSLHEADTAAQLLVARLALFGITDSLTVATHFTRRGPFPHITLSLKLSGHDVDTGWSLLEATAPAGAGGVRGLWCGNQSSGPTQLCTAAAEGATAHATRRSGRAVCFPGSDRLTGTLTVADVLSGSAIDRVRVLSATTDAAPGTVLVTREHLRPTWSGGLLVLATEIAAGNTLVPFENPDPTPCCADHP